ncbi:MAG: RNA 2',3'-cyclic phosphodiesterase [Ardenticatenia bacterium]|nr:RNA 2',3'-cyclic phosphodiesterase [Ardenticatenia bacterium]
MEADTVRVFVAVDVPEPVKAHLADVQQRLRRQPATAVVRWVEPRLGHVTVKFLGDVEVGRLPAVTEALAQVARSNRPFVTALGELGAFPNVTRPRVLWLGVADERRAFRRLARTVDRALVALGFAPAQRGPFVPHITLGRVRRRATAAERRALGDLVGRVEVPTGINLAVDHIVLMRSVLTPTGPVYTPLSRHILGQVAGAAEDEG